MKALIVVDAQNDFMPGGSLAVTDGDKIVSVVNDLLPEFKLVIFTKDWHPSNMDAFASQHEGKKPFDKYTTRDGSEDTLWPDHCVADTNGAELHNGIDFNKIKGDFYFFKKGENVFYHPYSGFGGTDLAEFLREKNVDKVFIVGLALDYCVADTAIDAAMEGFESVVIKDGTRPISEDINPTLEKFKEADVKVIDRWELSLYLL